MAARLIAFAGLLSVCLAAPQSGFAAQDFEGPILTEDGIYTESWFLESFLELADDIEEARSEGKRFAIMWELEGCPYCRETHFVNLQDPEIREFVKSNFLILQLNLQGTRMVVDFDGEEMSEKALARKYAIRFSPTFQFFPDAVDAGTAKPKDREVMRLPGYFRPPHFLAMFAYVHERAYERLRFRGFLREFLEKR